MIVAYARTTTPHTAAVKQKHNSDVKEMSELIHAHPTFAEIYAELFHLGAGMPIHG